MQTIAIAMTIVITILTYFFRANHFDSQRDYILIRVHHYYSILDVATYY